MHEAAVPGLATLLARAGSRCGSNTPSMACPALELATAAHFQSSAQAQQWMQAPPGQQVGYRRHGNVSVLQLEAAFAGLQRGALCLSVASGMAASLLVFAALLRNGDRVVLPNTLFYETEEQLQHLATTCGIGLDRVAGGSSKALLAACGAHTRMMVVESPSNPTLCTLDIAALAAACRARGILLVVDNTVLTPLAQNVLALGADISLYSLSKHLSGHGDVIAGMVCTRNPELHARMLRWRTCSGSGIDAFSAWLALRGLRTLPARLRSHAENGRAVADLLQRRFPRLHWRGAWNGPHARRNRINTRLHTGLMALRFTELQQAAAFVAGLRGIPVLPTFGNPESGVFHYAGVVDDVSALQACGIPPGLVRLSLGIEDRRDLVDDIGQALQAAAV